VLQPGAVGRRFNEENVIKPDVICRIMRFAVQCVSFENKSFQQTLCVCVC